MTARIHPGQGSLDEWWGNAVGVRQSAVSGGDNQIREAILADAEAQM